MLRDQARERVYDGAITDFLIELAIILVPLVRVYFKQSLH